MKKPCSDLPSAPSVKGEKITTGVNQTSFFKKFIEQSIFIDKKIFFYYHYLRLSVQGYRKYNITSKKDIKKKIRL